MKGVQENAQYFFKIHQKLIKPKAAVNIACPGCGRWFVKVNSNMVEISNDHGLGWSELKASDHWLQIKHSCGTKLNMYWVSG